MILSRDELKRLARRRHGSLEEAPFATLLHSLAVTKSNVVLAISRKQLRKEIVLDDGIPVACLSNLAHETLGRHLLATGRIDDDSFSTCLAEACSRELTIQEVVTEKGLVSAEELAKIVQQNLARKLLDVFTWREGKYKVHSRFPKLLHPNPINVPRLIVLGVSRYTSYREIEPVIVSLAEAELTLNPSPPYQVEEICLGPAQSRLIELLARGRPQRIAELAAANIIPDEELLRLVYALTLTHVVIPADSLPVEKEAAQSDLVAGGSAECHQVADELLQLASGCRCKDAFDLLGVSIEAPRWQVQKKFLQLAEQSAPWSHEPSLARQATEIFLMAAQAYGQLTSPKHRKQLRERRERRDRLRQVVSDQEPIHLETTLLDPETPYRRGKALIASGEYQAALVHLERAVDLDRQNPEYGAELAYCSFLASTSAAEGALIQLQEILRINPTYGLAHYYQGEILLKAGRLNEADAALRAAVDRMGPDPRPVSALRRLMAMKARADAE